MGDALNKQLRHRGCEPYVGGPSSPLTGLEEYKENLKWGEDRLPDCLCEPKVVQYCYEFSLKNHPGMLPATQTQNVQAPLLQEVGVACYLPLPQDCVGPAMPSLWLGVVARLAALAIMPMIALGTMECKDGPNGGGFADHASILDYALDALFLGMFVCIDFWLQLRIVKHTLVWQLPWLQKVKVLGVRSMCHLIPCWLWCIFVAFLSFLSLLNVWTNAEVLGRVLATFQYCPVAERAIGDRWDKALENTNFLMVFPWACNVLTLSTVMYVPAFLQIVFAFAFGATFDEEVGYQVGEHPDERHDSYSTRCQLQADHHSVVQCVSLLLSYVGVNFADDQRNRDLMSKSAKEAQDEVEEVTRSGGRLLRNFVEHDRKCSDLFEAVDNHHKAIQQEVNKSATKP